jgi:GNAT superfamily N-acetyltransferase
MIRVVRTAQLPHDITRLREEADRDSVRNMGLLVDEWASRAERFDGPGEALFAAFDGDTLIGTGGVTRETAVPAMRMRRLYVPKSHRGLGAGRLLAEAMIARGFESTDLLTCNARATPQAAPFWEAMEFVRVGVPSWTHERARADYCTI